MPPPRSALSHAMQRLALSLPADPLKPRFQLSSLLLSISSSLRDSPKSALAVEAVKSLANNELRKKYPISEKTLRPPSMPLHYSRLMEGIEKAGKGIKRSWWRRFFGIW